MLFTVLFDVKFRNFVTSKVAGVLLILGLLLNLLGLFVAVAFVNSPTFREAGSSFSTGLTILAILGFFVGAILWRVVLEVLVASVMSGEYSRKTFQQAALEGSQISQSIAREPQQNERENHFSQPHASQPSVAKARAGDNVEENPSSDPKAATDERAMVDDYLSNPREWVFAVLSSDEIELWMRAGSPDLVPYITAGLPDLEKWLKQRRLL